MYVIVQKKKHHQLRTILCGGYSGGKQFVTAEQLREKLSHLRYEKALIVKLVSAGYLTSIFDMKLMHYPETPRIWLIYVVVP